MGSLFDPTGGALYHLKALRYRRRLWAPFRRSLHRWLDDWNPRSRRLIVIGASGGHTLPTEWLRRFDRVDAYDIDLLAPWTFARNHQLKNIEFHLKDAVFSEGRFDSDLTRSLIEDADAAILWANILGQLPLKNDDDRALTAWWKDVHQALEGRPWASYHDLYSLPDRTGSMAALLSATGLSTIEGTGEHHLLEQLASLEEMPSLTKTGATLEVIDHGTNRLLGVDQWTTWRLSPRQWHFVGFSHE